MHPNSVSSMDHGMRMTVQGGHMCRGEGGRELKTANEGNTLNLQSGGHLLAMARLGAFVPTLQDAKLCSAQSFLVPSCSSDAVHASDQGGVLHPLGPGRVLEEAAGPVAGVVEGRIHPAAGVCVGQRTKLDRREGSHGRIASRLGVLAQGLE